MATPLARARAPRNPPSPQLWGGLPLSWPRVCIYRATLRACLSVRVRRCGGRPPPPPPIFRLAIPSDRWDEERERERGRVCERARVLGDGVASPRQPCVRSDSLPPRLSLRGVSTFSLFFPLSSLFRFPSSRQRRMFFLKDHRINAINNNS